MAEKRLICPSCSKKTLLTSTEKVDVLGEGVFLVSFSCECGFRSSDTYPEKEGKPSRFELRVGEKELSNYVLKSSSCRIEIPELDLEIDPGPLSEGYISTVEGVLLRIENTLKGNKKLPKRFFEDISRMKEKGGFTLIFEDRLGNSRIFGTKAKRLNP
jgi:zinc finger protein